MGNHLYCGLFHTSFRLLGNSFGNLFSFGYLFIAGRLVVFDLICADPLYFIMRGMQILIGNEDDGEILACLDFVDGTALLVEQERGDFYRKLCLDPMPLRTFS